MSHVSIGKGCASDVSRVTPASGSSRVEVGTYHDGFCDSLSTDIGKHDAVWVIVDRLTKSVHFLVVWMTFTLEEFYRL